MVTILPLREEYRGSEQAEHVELEIRLEVLRRRSGARDLVLVVDFED
jgi:hypothetical protein